MSTGRLGNNWGTHNPKQETDKQTKICDKYHGTGKVYENVDRDVAMNCDYAGRKNSDGWTVEQLTKQKKMMEEWEDTIDKKTKDTVKNEYIKLFGVWPLLVTGGGRRTPSSRRSNHHSKKRRQKKSKKSRRRSRKN